MAFGFLGRIVQDVGHDVSVAARGNDSPGGGAFGFLNKVQNTAYPKQTQPTPHGGVSLVANPNNEKVILPQAQAIARTVPEAVTSIIHPFSQATYTPGSPIEQAAFGTKPVQNIQEKVAKNYDAHSNLNPILRVGLAGAEAGASILQDTPVFKFLGGGAKTGVNIIANIDRKVGDAFPATKNLSVAKLGMSTQDVSGDVHIQTPEGVIRVAGDEMKALQEAKTPEDVRKVIGDSLPPQIVDKLATSIPNTKDPNIISNLISREVSPPLPRTTEDITPTPVVTPVEPAGQGTSETANNEAINSHLQTLQNANSTGPELQKAIEGLRQTHVQRDTQALSAQAKATVDKDYTGSLTHILTNENPSDKDVALAAHLVTKAQQDAKAAAEAGDTATHDAKIAEAVSIAERTDKILRESGRTSQAGSIISRLTPEGQLQFAARKLRQVREANPKNITRENKTAGDIQKTVEGSVPQFDRGSVQQAVKDIASGQQKLDLGGLEGGAQAGENTGQALAKNVERAATPQVKQKADALVAELTKKVKQEYLDAPITAKKSPLSVLQEVFGRNAEAQDAYPLAQKILRDKYANVPKMQEALDKFFGSKLDLPAANTTIDRAISDQLKTNGERISDVIYKSLTTQEATVKNVANDLVKEGFDQQSATKLSEEVAKRLNQQVIDAKTSALNRLAQDVKPRAQATYLDKINKFSNLGALTNEDYLHLARAKLNLPQLTPELADKIHGLSQDLQSLPEGHDKYALVREIQRTVQDAIPKSKWQTVKDFIGLPRTILSSGDFSFGGRQGLAYLTSHPIRFAQGWAKQFEYFKQGFAGKDSEAYDAMMADIRAHPDFHLLEQSPAHLLEISGHSTDLRGEDYISSDLAEKFPVLGRLVRASNYAYTGLGNYLRANEFYAQIEHLRYANEPITKELTDGIGEQISTSLGRGGKPGGFVEKHGGFLSTALFSPRLAASRLQVMNPAYYIRLPAPARAEALRSLIGLSAFAVGTLALAKQAGADVSVDPRSADFGKIKVGDTRFDALGGFTQYVRFGTQLLTGQKINSTTGAETEVGKGVTGSRLDIASNFIQGKENPALSFVTTLLKGKDVSGNNIYTTKGVASQTLQRFIPLLAQDINDLKSHPNAVGGSTVGKALAPVAGVFGVGLQTYGTQDEPTTAKQQTYLTNLQKSGADQNTIKANTAFFQSLKIAAGKKTNANTAVDAALKSKDLAGAQQAADTYNKELAAGMTKWAQQYGEKYGNQDLQTAYDRQKINLTPSSLQSRIKAIQSTKPY